VISMESISPCDRPGSWEHSLFCANLVWQSAYVRVAAGCRRSMPGLIDKSNLSVPGCMMPDAPLDASRIEAWRRPNAAGMAGGRGGGCGCWRTFTRDLTDADDCQLSARWATPVVFIAARRLAHGREIPGIKLSLTG
jgi:hypothetical protein